jgi:hypothetical protein
MILKAKKVVHYKFRTGRPRVAPAKPREAAGAQAVAPEPKRVYVGTITTAPGETFALNVPPDADAETIKQAIEKGERERTEETRRLRELFLKGERDE